MGYLLARRVWRGDLAGGQPQRHLGLDRPADGHRVRARGLSERRSAFVDLTDADAADRRRRSCRTETFANVVARRQGLPNHAFVVGDNAGAHGMQVFDLTRLRSLDRSGGPVSFTADVGLRPDRLRPQRRHQRGDGVRLRRRARFARTPRLPASVRRPGLPRDQRLGPQEPDVRRLLLGRVRGRATRDRAGLHPRRPVRRLPRARHRLRRPRALLRRQRGRTSRCST